MDNVESLEIDADIDIDDEDTGASNDTVPLNIVLTNDLGTSAVSTGDLTPPPSSHEPTPPPQALPEDQGNTDEDQAQVEGNGEEEKHEEMVSMAKHTRKEDETAEARRRATRLIFEVTQKYPHCLQPSQ